MTVVWCRRFPRGTVHIRTAGGVVVDFRDGRADVDDPELVAALLAVPPVFEIEAEPPPAPDPPSPGSPPARRGPGSATEAWMAYAHTHNIPVPDEYGRDQIIKMLDDLGVPT